MGSVHYPGSSLTDFLIEIVGFKCGVALSKDQLREALNKAGYSQFADLTDESYVRLHSTAVEELVWDLMRVFGRLEENFTKFPTIAIWHKVKNNKAQSDMYMDIMDMHIRWAKKEMRAARKRESKLMDPKALIVAVAKKYGNAGIDMVMAIIMGLEATRVADVWSNTREVEWINQIELQHLFDNENLNAMYGSFFDQRYIDYLHRNFSKIDDVNWRQFEHFTAEYLDREGYKVALGPGRADDGVDVRAWIDDDTNSSPHIIVQCKRQKSDVPKVVIKALYADILHENAKSGLLVTTSRIAPGTEDTRLARAYPIDVADRASLRKWLLEMRKPGLSSLFFSN